MQEGIVTKAIGGFFFVYHGGRTYRCVARGKLRRRHPEGEAPGRIVPGDRVRFVPLSPQEGLIEEVLPRAQQLTKPAAADPHRLAPQPRADPAPDVAAPSPAESSSARPASAPDRPSRPRH